MAENPGEVLFIRGEENSEDDIWDDTALIAAYDKAVGTAKKLIKDKEKASLTASASGDSASESGANANSFQTKRSNRARKSHGHQHNRKQTQDARNASNKWSVGDRCSCTYSMDGIMYDAIILSIDEESRTCWVSYVDYGNEEEFNLDELRPAINFKSSPRKKSHQPDLNGDDSGAANDKMKVPKFRSRNTSSGQRNFPSPHLQQGPPFPPLGANIPPMGIPPPIALFDEGEAVEDNDAMSSMLMSWYMCGYHSGFYQGLKQSKRQTNL